jgi:phosphomannomutase
MTDLAKKARKWADGDPDEQTSAELLAIADSGDQIKLQQAMGGVLEFGTAGIRGAVGPGSNQMNRAVIIKTSRGLVEYLLDKYSGPPLAPVLVGFDARPTSRQFAEDTVGVLVAAGINVVYFDQVTPTPIVAFAAKILDASAAVVVTASHNPPADNGYKVYDSNAAQIIPPTDQEIANAIEATGAANTIPRVANVFANTHPLAALAPDSILDDYFDEVSRYRKILPSRTIRIVYTPLHGVGGATVADLFARTIHSDFHPVPEQFAPDGTFPTVSFPNPEEKGALDLALETARSVRADLVIANDPDADRLAAAIPHGHEWRLFTGNELGVILGAHLLANMPESSDSPPITANSIVSSPMLSEIAAAHKAVHLTTLTGFKWIVNAALAVESETQSKFLFGYEEALGFSVGQTVRDKDGISAAILLADIAALQSEKGETLLDLLHGLWREYGLWVSTQRSLVRPGPEGQQEIVKALEKVADAPPKLVGGVPVSNVTDYRFGAENRPKWLGAQELLQLDLDGGRILARPSGTEPKLKIYVDLKDVVDPSTDGPALQLHRESSLERAESIAGAFASVLEESM